MTNPFENPEGRYLVLVNDDGQHSPWPTIVDIPASWNQVFGDDTRDACLAYIESNWTDLRSKSLREQMYGSSAS